MVSCFLNENKFFGGIYFVQNHSKLWRETRRIDKCNRLVSVKSFSSNIADHYGTDCFFKHTNPYEYKNYQFNAEDIS